MSFAAEFEPTPSENINTATYETGIIPTIEVMPEVASERSSWIERLRNVGRVAVLSAAVTPANEMMRFGAAGVAQATTGNSLVGGAAFGLTTLAVEGLGARSTANLINTKHGGKMFDWLNQKINTRKEKSLKGRSMTAPVEAMVAYFGGSSVVLAAKQIENPSRTLEQNKRHGDLTAAWLSSILTIQWVAGGNAIQEQTPTTVGAFVASTLGAYAGVKFAQSRSNPKQEVA